MTADPPPPPSDDKDWTWVLDVPCPDCGFEAVSVDPAGLGAAVRAAAAAMAVELGRPDARDRPRPEVWSVLEYGCHVRDACTIFDGRLRLMLHEDDPQFANWDQDETARTGRYWQQDPAVVRAELASAADAVATGFDRVEAEQWTRTGRRSNGSVFTVDSLGRYFLHDLVHHLHDVRSAGG